MFSKPLAFGVLVVACVTAAGGGAYYATLQHARSTTAAPQSLPAAPATQATQPVAEAALATPASTAQVPPSDTSSQISAAGASPSSPAAASGMPRAFGPSARPADKRVDRRAGAKASEPVSPASNLQAAAPAASTFSDPAGSGQRPWPGPPSTPQGTVPALPPATEPVRGEPELQPQENVRLWEELLVPAESVLGLQLESSINTERARVEDRVDARLTRDVRVHGRVAIPAGTRVIGSVVMVERGGRMKERARIGIRFNTLVLADASKISISTDTVYREGESPANQASAKIGGAAIGGAIIGAILGGGKGAAIGSGLGAAGGAAAAMNADRQPVVMPAGTTLSVRTQAPVTVSIEK
jgi:hypothetical protein